jgi:cell division transport system permease protein
MSMEPRLARAGHFFREAWKNIRSAPILTTVAVLTIAVSLILVGLFGFIMINAGRVLDAVAEDLRITIYLAEDVTPDEVDSLQKLIANRDEVDSVTFLTAEDDRARNVTLLSSELLEGLDQEAIPGQPAVEELTHVESVQEAYFGADKIRILFAVIDLVRFTGVLICAIVLAAAIFFTFSTIKLAVYARKEEIEVLRLVGATDGFIRAPFYIEGALAGLCGSLTALTIIAFIHSKLIAFVEEEHFLNVSLDLMPAGVVLWLLFGGVTLGLTGSALSLGRYLRT